jgi:hypothetical protein
MSQNNPDIPDRYRCIHCGEQTGDEGLALADRGATPTEAQVKHLAALRSTYEELSEAYEGTRRMVERGYLCYLETGG